MSDGPRPKPIPLAYLLTWTTYGTWLRGDQRGSVVDSNKFGDEYHGANSTLRARDYHSLRHSPIRLRSADRAIVDEAIWDVCEHRGWILHALNVRSNHVHAVASANEPPERLLVDLKAWSTRNLRECDAERFNGRTWTKHGSTRYLFDEPSVQGAIDYVLRHQ